MIKQVKIKIEGDPGTGRSLILKTIKFELSVEPYVQRIVQISEHCIELDIDTDFLSEEINKPV